MSDKLTYKAYSGSMEFSLEDDCLFGRIQDINDIITYEGNTVSELKAAFEVAVDEYLQFCLENNKEADKPYSGSFNVRVEKALHKQASIVARDRGISLNSLVGEALESHLNESRSREVQVIGEEAQAFTQAPLIVSSSGPMFSFYTGSSEPEDYFTVTSTSKLREASNERKH